MHRQTGIGVALLLTWQSAGASAQDPVAAAANFERGVKEMKAGNFVVACPALAESDRLEPRPGTLFALAECEARWGRLATATAHYQDYTTRVSRLPAADQEAHRERVAIAATRVADLEPRIPKLTLVLPPDAPPGTEVRRDDVVLGAPSLGTPLAIDPGTHELATRAPGGTPHQQTVELQPGESKTVELVVNPAPAPPPPPIVRAIPIAPAVAQLPPPRPNDRRTAGFVVGGVGLAGITAGVVAGALVLGEKSAVDRDCGPDGACRGNGLAEATTLQTTAQVSNVTFGVGGALLVAGAILVLTAPSTPPATKSAMVVRWLVSAGPGSAALGLGGAW